MTTGVYLGSYPAPQFAFPRSYAIALTTLGDSNDIEISDDTITMYIDRTLNYGVVYVLFPYVIPWSSNRYTLDHIVYDCWWFYGFDGVHHPQAFTTNYWIRTAANVPCVTVVQPLAGTFEAIIPLPSQPPGYWLPSPILPSS